MYSTWQDTYKSKLIDFKEAARKIQSGDFVITALGPGACSPEFWEAILDRHTELQNVVLSDSMQMRPCRLYDPVFMQKLNGHLKYAPAFGIARVRESYNAKCDYLINNLSDSGARYLQRASVFICQVSPPDQNGYMNLGLCNDYSLEFLKNRSAGNVRLTIAEVNEQMPIVYGNNWVHVSDFDYCIANNSALPIFKRNPSTDLEKSIAAYVLDLITDGCTIQMGLGGITEAVFAGLTGKHDLGVHSEMLPVSLPRLAAEGIVNNKNKPAHQGVSVGTFCIGDEEMYQYVAENPAVHLYPGCYINNSAQLARIPNLVAVNMALMVDLTGQIASEGLGYRMVSGSGGQLDFALGGFWSSGGKSVTLLRSAHRTADGTLVSSIVPGLPEGTPVTVPRSFANYVVTEYGIANLRDKTLQERAQALIAIAHPELRGELRHSMQKHFYHS